MNDGSGGRWRRGTVRFSYDDAVLVDFVAPPSQLPGRSAADDDGDQAEDESGEAKPDPSDS